MTARSGYVEGAALVAGRAAAVIARTMRDAIAQQRKRDGVGQIAPDLLVAIEAMERAGQRWVSASGSEEAPRRKSRHHRPMPSSTQPKRPSCWASPTAVCASSSPAGRWPRRPSSPIASTPSRFSP